MPVNSRCRIDTSAINQQSFINDNDNVVVTAAYALGSDFVTIYHFVNVGITAGPLASEDRVNVAARESFPPGDPAQNYKPKDIGD